MVRILCDLNERKDKIMNKRILTLLLVVFMTFNLMACGSEQSSSKTSSTSNSTSDDLSTDSVAIKIASAGQDNMPALQALIDVMKNIEKENNNVNFNYYGARQLGDDDAILQQVMNGTLQMGAISLSAFSTYTDILDAFTIPFLINNYETERKIVNSDEAKALFNKAGEELGLKILGAYDFGMRHIANNKRPINSVDDLKGLKIRVAPTNILINSFKNLGANPSTMNYSEIYTGLQNNVIDGEEINITSIFSEKHYEVINYFTEIGLYPFECLIVCNLDWYNSLDDDTELLLQSGVDSGYDLLFNKYLAEMEKAGYEAMKNSGVDINKINDSSEFRETIQGIIEEYRQSDPLVESFIDKVLSE